MDSDSDSGILAVWNDPNRSASSVQPGVNVLDAVNHNDLHSPMSSESDNSSVFVVWDGPELPASGTQSGRNVPDAVDHNGLHLLMSSDSDNSSVLDVWDGPELSASGTQSGTNVPDAVNNARASPASTQAVLQDSTRLYNNNNNNNNRSAAAQPASPIVTRKRVCSDKTAGSSNYASRNVAASPRRKNLFASYAVDENSPPGSQLQALLVLDPNDHRKPAAVIHSKPVSTRRHADESSGGRRPKKTRKKAKSAGEFP